MEAAEGGGGMYCVGVKPDSNYGVPADSIEGPLGRLRL
jgi:hypothetical protein